MPIGKGSADSCLALPSLMTNLEDEVCRAADGRQSRPAPALLRSGLPPNPERPALSTIFVGINVCELSGGYSALATFLRPYSLKR